MVKSLILSRVLKLENFEIVIKRGGKKLACNCFSALVFVPSDLENGIHGSSS